MGGQEETSRAKGVDSRNESDESINLWQDLLQNKNFIGSFSNP